MPKKIENLSKSDGEPRAIAGNVSVWCAFDKLVDPSTLVPNPKNPNKHPKKQIKLLSKIITTQGWRAPITVSLRSGFVVKGHGRLEAALLAAIPFVPIDYQVYATEADEYADLIADNRLAELAKTDKAIMAGLLEELQQMDFDSELTGFDDKEIQSLITHEQEKETGENKTEIIKAANIDELAPSDEERKAIDGRTIVVEFSGGKDSSATSVWARHFYPDAEIILCFIDMGADFVGFNTFLYDFAAALGAKLAPQRSSVNMVDRFIQKCDWPNFKHPFCHDILHDTLDMFLKKFNPKEMVIMRGGRAAEKGRQQKAKTSRFLQVDRMKEYTYFQPLYFAGKGVGESILSNAGVPIWDGYSYGLQRTACRICPGQKPAAYAAIRANFPDVWEELLYLERRFGAGCWQRRDTVGNSLSFVEMADAGQKAFEEGNYLRRY